MSPFAKAHKGGFNKNDKKNVLKKTKNIASKTKKSSAKKNVFLRNAGGGFRRMPPMRQKGVFYFVWVVWAVTTPGRVGLQRSGRRESVGWRSLST